MPAEIAEKLRAGLKPKTTSLPACFFFLGSVAAHEGLKR
jgi:hypothetical protein